MTLLEFLIAKYPTAKRQTFKRMLEAGRLTINGRRPRALKVDVQADDVVVVKDIPKPRERAPKLPFAIVHEDEDLLVIDKPPGLLTSTVPHEQRLTALAAATEYLARTDPRSRIGLIHRLDRDASGLLVFSKNANAYHALKEQFFKHAAQRIYHAIVERTPKPAADKIESHLLESHDGTVRSLKGATPEGKDAGQLAITHYVLLKSAKGESLLRVTLETGRKHQIRAHLAERGHPIVNDVMYSSHKKRTGRLMLAATELSFDHPRTGARVKLELPLPTELSSRVR